MLVTGAFLYAAGGNLFISQRGELQPTLHSSTPKGGASKGHKVDMTADDAYILEKGDSTLFILVGDFAAHHNGAVITADSAVRYSNQSFECFGDVLINQNTTYIYGDRASYNSDLSVATVYSDLVKIVDDDATMYTYHCQFDTSAELGKFYGGCYVRTENSLMESDRGYYNTKSHELIAVDRVEMRDDIYLMRADSVIFNTETEDAQYFTNTNIWNDKEEYLFADAGSYTKAKDLHHLTCNAYILSPEREIWSDSIEYYRTEGHIIGRRNIQIEDTTRKILGFADYGEWWDEPGNALFTRRPSMINYSPEYPDSVFLRADTLWLYTVPVVAEVPATDSLPALQSDVPLEKKEVQAESKAESTPSEKPSKEDAVKGNDKGKDAVKDKGNGREAIGPQRIEAAANGEKSIDSLAEERSEIVADSLVMERVMADSLQCDTLQQDSLKVLTKRQLRYRAKLEKRALRDSLRAIRAAERDSIRKIKDSIARIETDSLIAKRKERNIRIAEEEAERMERIKQKVEAHRRKKIDRAKARAARRGKEYKGEEYTLEAADSTAEQQLSKERGADTTGRDAMPADSLTTDSLSNAAIVIPPDSCYKMVKAYRNVKMYRTDSQIVCDSLVTLNTDSIVRLFNDPVLWNQKNQIASDSMYIYTRRQQLDKAHFMGDPLMGTEIDTMYYNQVKGKDMIAYFADGKVYRNDVNGNAQTIYYMQEEDTPEVTGLMYIESSGISFYLENGEMDKIAYKQNPEYVLYPMNMIPETQIQRLPDFEWYDERRPLRDSIVDREIRRTQRDDSLSRVKPSFRITERIDYDRRRLTENRMWEDRVDLLPPDVVEWRNSRPSYQKK